MYSVFLPYGIEAIRGEYSAVTTNRGILVLGILGLLMFLSVSIACRLIIVPLENPKNYIPALGFGVLTAIGVCWYLARSWDPVNLKPVDPRQAKAPHWLMPLVVGGGILANQITSRIFPTSFTQQVAVCLIVPFYAMFIYMAIQVWRYWPRQ